MLKERKNIQFPRNTNRPKSAPIGQCASQCVFACHSNPLGCLVLLNGIRLASRDDDNWIRSRPLSNSGTILVVDDVEVVRTFTAMVLKSQCYTVLEADRGFEALRIFSEQKDRIDLVLTDIRMPEMNGLELARQLTRHRPD